MIIQGKFGKCERQYKTCALRVIVKCDHSVKLSCYVKKTRITQLYTYVQPTL